MARCGSGSGLGPLRLDAPWKRGGAEEQGEGATAGLHSITAAYSALFGIVSNPGLSRLDRVLAVHSSDTCAVIGGKVVVDNAYATLGWR